MTAFIRGQEQVEIGVNLPSKRGSYLVVFLWRLDWLFPMWVPRFYVLSAKRIEAIRDWESREATRDSILLTIRDFLWDETSGLPVDQYSEEEVHTRADEIFRHVYRVYPTLPSPYYAVEAVA